MVRAAHRLFDGEIRHEPRGARARRRIAFQRHLPAAGGPIENLLYHHDRWGRNFCVGRWWCRLLQLRRKRVLVFFFVCHCKRPPFQALKIKVLVSMFLQLFRYYVKDTLDLSPAHNYLSNLFLLCIYLHQSQLCRHLLLNPYILL